MRCTAGAGGNGKVTPVLVASMMEMSDFEDRQFGEKAHPQLRPQHRHLCFPEPRAGCSRLVFDHTFTGLRYVALSAPGSTGTRAEHVTDLLNVSRRTRGREAVDFSGELRQAILWVDHAATGLCSTGNAQTPPNSLTTCDSTETRWTPRCWPRSTPNSVLPSARFCLWTCLPAAGCRPPLASCSVGLASVPHNPWSCPSSWPAGSFHAPLRGTATGLAPARSRQAY